MQELIQERLIFNFMEAKQSQLDQQIKWDKLNNQLSQNQSQLSYSKQNIKLWKTSEIQIQLPIKIKPKQIMKCNWFITKRQADSFCFLFDKHVFVKKTKQRKNPNFTKFLISGFCKEIKRLKNENLLTEEHKAFCQKAKKEYQKNGRRNIQMQSLNILFGKDIQNQLCVKFNRSVLYNLLGRQDFKKYIVQNPFAKEHNKKKHLIAAKVYRLRCKSASLTGRTQSK